MVDTTALNQLPANRVLSIADAMEILGMSEVNFVQLMAPVRKARLRGDIWEECSFFWGYSVSDIRLALHIRDLQQLVDTHNAVSRARPDREVIINGLRLNVEDLQTQRRNLTAEVDALTQELRVARDRAEGMRNNRDSLQSINEKLQQENSADRGEAQGACTRLRAELATVRAKVEQQAAAIIQYMKNVAEFYGKWEDEARARRAEAIVNDAQVTELRQQCSDRGVQKLVDQINELKVELLQADIRRNEDLQKVQQAYTLLGRSLDGHTIPPSKGGTAAG